MTSQFKNGRPLYDSFAEGRYVTEELIQFKQEILMKPYHSQGTKVAVRYLDKLIECFQARYDSNKEDFPQGGREL